MDEETHAEGIPAADDPRESTSAADATTGSTVLSGGLWNGLSTLLPPLYGLVQSVVAARILGPELFGVQTYIAWASVSVVLLLGVGMSRALSQYVATLLGADKAGSLRDLVRWAWGVQALVALFGGAALAVVAVRSDDQALSWALVAGVCVVSVLQPVPASVLIGLQRWRPYTVIGLVTGLLGTVATVLVLAAGGGIAGMFAVEFGAGLIGLVWASVLAARVLPARSGASRAGLGMRREMGSYAALMTVQALLTLIVWRRSEVFFLERYASTSQIALYSVAFGIVFAVQQLPGGLAGALTPALATLLGAGQTDRIRVGVGRAMRLVLLVSLPMTAGLLAVGPALITLVYGTDFAPAGAILLVFVGVLPLVTVALVAGAVLQAYGLVRQMIWTGIAATIVDIGLVLLLVPGHGAMGAALANTAAQATLAGLRVWFAVRVVGGIDPQLATVARAVVAAAAAGLAAWVPVLALGGFLGLAAGVIGGVVVFGVASSVLGVLGSDDAAWMRDTAGHRLGGLVGRACVLVERRDGA